MTLSAEMRSILRGPELERLPVISFVDHPAHAATLDHGNFPFGQNNIENRVEAARSEGFAEGLERGRIDGEAALLAGSISGIDRAAELLASERQSLVLDVSRQVVELALALTETLLARELAASTDPGLEAIERCLDHLPTNEAVVIHLNPEDLAGLGSTANLLSGRSCELVGDRSVASGDAMVATPGGSIDSSISSALARVAEVLRS